MLITSCFTSCVFSEALDNCCLQGGQRWLAIEVHLVRKVQGKLRGAEGVVGGGAGAASMPVALQIASEEEAQVCSPFPQPFQQPCMPHCRPRYHFSLVLQIISTLLSVIT